VLRLDGKRVHLLGPHLHAVGRVVGASGKDTRHLLALVLHDGLEPACVRRRGDNDDRPKSTEWISPMPSSCAPCVAKLKSGCGIDVSLEPRSSLPKKDCQMGLAYVDIVHIRCESRRFGR